MYIKINCTKKNGKEKIEFLKKSIVHSVCLFSLSGCGTITCDYSPYNIT